MFLKRIFSIFLIISSIAFLSCKSSPVSPNNSQNDNIEKTPVIENTNPIENDSFLETENESLDSTEIKITDTPNIKLQASTKETVECTPITLLFGGDVMAHTENYNISSYSKIWASVTDIIKDADFAFANIESPIDTTLPASTYPNFNMTRNYVQAVIDAGFNVFSLCNNHTTDQGISGITNTGITMSQLAEANNNNIYYSGLKDSADAPFTYNVLEKNGWRIIFLPISEIINKSKGISYMNFQAPTKTNREKLYSYIKEIKEKEKCDLFILSIHTNEPEYIREVTDAQEEYYMTLLDNGVDIIWANHTHLIKNRKVVVDTKTNSDKLIMYANGNTISGQRREPKLTSTWPNGERDNTGDGLLFKVTLVKNEDSIQIQKAEPIIITTYINTANEFIIKLLDDDFIDYLYSVNRPTWARYITRRKLIDKQETKDLIEWR